MSEPNTADWITAIAALFGIGPIIWGVVKLFLRDKEKEERLKFVQGQLDELKRQTSEFQYQSTLMREANDLLEKQVALQTDMYLQTKDIEHKKLEIEKQKRIAETKPHFVFQTASSSPDGFECKLRNNGATAENIRIHENTEFLRMRPLRDNLRAETGQVIEIGGAADMTKTYFNSNQVTGQILISFKDVDKREYFQNIRKTSDGFNIEPPYLREV
jgi:hypothetical protein